VPSLAARVDAVTLQQVGEAAAARLKSTNRTLGWFDPQPSTDEEAPHAGEGAGAGPATEQRR
jgi:hypothetical protein